MNEQQLAPMGVGFAVAVVLFLVIGYFLRKRNMTAHLAPVKRELKKEKQWLRRGEYNAAMVKGRQNLELFLKLVAEFNGIELDNSAQAMANAKSGSDGRGQRETYRMNGRKRQRVMTFQQFGWWLDENGYLDRVGKWELNEIRVIGNKAVHENYVSKEDAWNQYNYMEDLLRIVADRHANRRKQRGPAVKKSQAGRHGANNGGQNQSKKRDGRKETGSKKTQNARPNGNAKKEVKGKSGAKQEKGGEQVKKAEQNTGKKKTEGQKSAAGQNRQVQKNKTVKTDAKSPAKVKEPEAAKDAQPEKLSSSAKRRQRRKRAKAAREAAEAAGMVRETAPQEKAAKQTESRQNGVKEKTAKQPENRPVRQENRTNRQPRQVQPQTSMRIVTLSQTSSSQKSAEKQPQGEAAAKQPARRRRRPRRRPAAEQAGNTAERIVEKAAAGGGDHEE